MTGDSLVVDKVYTDFKERQQQFTVSTRSSVSDLSSINEAYSRQKDRKVGLYLSVSSGIIHADFTSQKTTLFLISECQITGISQPRIDIEFIGQSLIQSSCP